jgi:hypothetical protein
VIATRSPSAAVRLLGLSGRTLPPELSAGEPPDERSDVFLAGSLLERMAGADGRRIPRSLAAELRRATAGRDERTASAAELRDRLRVLRRSRVDGSGPAVSWEDVGGLGKRRGVRERRSWLGTWLAVPALVALAAGLAIILGLWLGALELGGPLGVRPPGDRPGSSAADRPIAVEHTTVVDPPPGDGTENDDLLQLATDGDPSTAWKTSNYYDGDLNKPGVGLRFDLGRDVVITGIRLWTPSPGWTFQLEIGDEPSALPTTHGAQTFTSTSVDRVRLAPTTGRYVLLWITSVVPTEDGNRAEVAEFEPIGRDA